MFLPAWRTRHVAALFPYYQPKPLRHETPTYRSTRFLPGFSRIFLGFQKIYPTSKKTLRQILTPFELRA